MTTSIGGTTGVTFPDASVQTTAATGFGFKNRIINGAMMIDQRNAGAVVSGETYLVDRWRVWRNQTYDIQQSTDAPAGFINSLKVTKTSSTQSLYGYLVQYIEGFNCADLNFGSTSASPVSISFWVKSSVVGAFSVGLVNGNVNRTYATNYTINSANTWEYKTVTIPGDVSGTWAKDSGKGVGLCFNFGGSVTMSGNVWNASDFSPVTGSANLGTTNGATFYITGVQLEKGSTATSFDYRPYGTELALCQRYYQYLSAGIASGDSNNNARAYWFFKTTMRAIPTFTAGASSQGSLGGILPDFAMYTNPTYAVMNTGSNVSAEL